MLYSLHMSERKPKPPAQLLGEGAAWARERYIGEKSRDLTTFLRGALTNSLGIFEVHRAKMAEFIAEHGGITEVIQANLDIDHSRTKLVDGERLQPSDLLGHTVFEQPLDTSHLPANTEQIYSLLMSYGGRNIGVRAEEAVDEYHLNKSIFIRNIFEKFLTPDFAPHAVCITERVTTKQGNNRSISQDHYLINTDVWYAKLRETFVPNPLTHPSEYAHWVRSDPIRVEDISFAASGQLDSKRSPGKTYKDVKNYINRLGYMDEHAIAIEKLTRYLELLEFCHRRVTGMDLVVMEGLSLPITESHQLDVGAV